jgi:N-acyl-D-aspartate/D-glutamate deacylase
MLIGVATYHGLMRRPTFRRLESELSYEDLLQELQKPEVKAAILSEENLPEDPQRQYESLGDNMAYMFERLFVLGDPPDYEPTRDRSIAGIAEASGKGAWEVLYDSIAGGALLLGAFTNYANTSQDHLAVMLEDPHTVLGLSDGGAHVRFICDASLPTYMLTHWTRDRTRGDRMSIESIVRKQTALTAEVVGLTDRGTLEVGKKADINVIDLEHLTLHPPHPIDDLPAGGRRILQDASGYVATIVNGVVTRRDDSDTGARPGRLVRASH